MTALVTAIYGGFDTLKDPEPQESVDEYVCVTDDPALRSDVWRVVVEPRPGVHPCLAAKRPKMLPHLYTHESKVVWIDASHRPTSPWFCAEALDAMDEQGIAQFRHPWRDCIYDEADACAHVPKYADQPICAQADSYRDCHPPHWGLWETGVIVRRMDDRTKALGTAWLAECERWSFQDQLSEAVLLRLFSLRPAEFRHDARANPWFAYEPSERH